LAILHFFFTRLDFNFFFS